MAQKKFKPFPLDQLHPLTELPFDIYISLSSGRILKIGKAGQSLLRESLERYEEKGVEHVLVLHDDLKRYQQESRKISDSADDKKTGTRLIELLDRSQGIYQDLNTLGFQSSSLEEANEVAEEALSFFEEEPSLQEILEELRFYEDPVASHCMAVGTMAVMVARSQGWLHPSNFKKLFLGGLLHDIGLLMLPEHLRSKLPEEMDSVELKIYQGHSAMGFKSLARVKGVPKEVLSIVLEHHEGRKKGFPKGLKETEIHPMARLIAMADQFTDYTFGPVQKPGHGARPAPEALQALMENPSGTFKREDLQSLEQLLKRPDS